MSIFSDLNNLKDITLDARFADICGISEADLHEVFDESIKELGDANGLTYEETCQRLKDQYDGYHFCENSIGVYNPFSLLNTFDRLSRDMIPNLICIYLTIQTKKWKRDLSTFLFLISHH